jgi:glycogen debranching enzyme
VCGADAHRIDEDVVVHGEGWWLACSAQPQALARRFGFGISYRSADEALARGRAAREVDLAKVTCERLRFYEEAPIPDWLAGNPRRAYYKALSVQKVNIESAQQDIPCRWTTPDRMPHRHMWLWDTAFHALGLRHVRPDLAEDALRALLAKQCENGKLALAVQPGVAPSPEDDAQPPIVAWSLAQWPSSSDAAFWREVYPALVRYVAWFETHRKDATGLYGWRIRADDDPIRGARGGESGMDNSPRFDDVTRMTAVDLSSYMAAEYAALEQMARGLGLDDDARQWRARRDAIAEQVNTLLWDDVDQFYYDLDDSGEFIRVMTTAGFMPLLGGIPDRNRAEALRMHVTHPHEFYSPFPVCSVALDDYRFNGDMWRGPSWPNVNVLLYHGLTAYGFHEEAHTIAHKTLAEITRLYMMHGCFYEYYDALGKQPPAELPRKGAPGELGGVGFGVVEDLHWTAAAFVHLAYELD